MRLSTGAAMMMRFVVGCCAAMGAAIAVLVVATVPIGAPVNPLGSLFGASERTGANAPITEIWPICTTMGSVTEESDWAQLDPDLAAGKKALAAGQWTSAVVSLRRAALRDPHNADIHNYIGYAHRRLGQPDAALAHYQKAITYNPRHRGAHQHLGEAYLAQGNFGKAEEHLAALERICLIPCEEYGDLQRAMVARMASTR
jgi:hypothetical protein